MGTDEVRAYFSRSCSTTAISSTALLLNLDSICQSDQYLISSSDAHSILKALESFLAEFNDEVILTET